MCTRKASGMKRNLESSTGKTGSCVIHNHQLENIMDEADKLMSVQL
jgi:hypothetical protein